VNNTALLILDLQKDFLETDGRMTIGANSEKVIGTANRMLEHADRMGWNKVFIQNEFPTSDWMGNFFRKGAAIEGSAGAERDERILYPKEYSTFSKSQADAFSNLALALHLKKENIQSIVILGVMAEGCVRATVQKARHLGFSVTVVSDGVASSRNFLKNFGLKSMRKAGARIKECSEILNESK
jgi:nicotinamidase-related amidase